MRKPYCDHCGDCCRGLGADFGIEIHPSDAARMAAFLELDLATFWSRHTYAEALPNGQSVRYLFDQNGECIFLQDNRCTVHEAKPMQCYLGWPDGNFIRRMKRRSKYPCVQSKATALAIG